MKKPCVLTIAGSDSSAGAGIQADIKAISATGAYAASVITALTAQNTLGVQAIYEIPANFIEQQIHSVLSDLTVKAIKIGMLYHQETINMIAQYHFPLIPIILDPVLVAKDGSPLLKSDTLTFYKNKLFSRATLITPNIPEAMTLMDTEITNEQEMEEACIHLGNHYKTNVLLKGGHLTGNQSSDVLYLYQNKICHWFHTERIQTKNTHGTGCTLSSAIASYLAQGKTLIKAIQLAKQYLFQAIYHGQYLRVGQGAGPVNHFYKG